MAIENPIHKIRICAESFNSSLTLSCYDTNKLLGVGKKYPRPRILAELYIRYCFAPNAELKQMVGDLFPEPIRQELWDAAVKFPYGDSPFATDLDTGDSRSIKDAINERWRYYVDADGAFPVCSENDAFLLPFYLEEHIENTPWVVDCDGKEIPEWGEAVKSLSIQSQVKVAVSVSTPLKGHSLQLPVFLASLVKQGKLLPFDPCRFIATGAIEADKLQPVQFTAKYEVLREKYPNAFFVCPKPEEDCVIADTNTGIMPIGFSLHNTRNFCAEFIIKHHLLKNEPANKRFAGRQYELSKIHFFLNPYSQRNKKIPLLLGASGIGKTALANQYAQIMTGCEYHGYALLEGDSNSLPNLFNTFYYNPTNQERFGFTISEILKTPKEKFESFLHQLKQNGKRILFILDNLSPELQLNEDIDVFFPDYAESCIDFIATANICQFYVNNEDVVCTLKIDGLSVIDGINLLQNKRAIESAEEREAAEGIINVLGGNAWALTVVGETLKQAPEKFDDDYREKLKELRLLPLETLTPGSSMVRISHGKEIDPVKLLQPVLARLDQEILEIAQAAACCASEYIYPKWLQKFYELKHNVKFKNERQWRKEKIIAKLIQSNILSADEMGSEYYRMHRLTHLIIRKIYKEKNLQTENNLLRAVAADKPMCCPAEIIAAGHLLANISAAYSQAFELLSAGKDHLLSLLLRSSQYGLARTLISRFLPLSENTEIVASEERQREYTINLLYCLVETKLLDNELDQALEIMNKVCDIQKSASHVDYCSSLCETARIYIWLKKYEKAAEFLDEVRRTIEEHNLCNTYIHYVYLRRSAILDNWLAWQKGNPEFYKYAESKLKEALLIREKLSEPLYETIRLRHLLGDCLRFQGKIEECLKIYTVCEEYYIKELGENNTTTAQLFINKADALTSIRDFQGAINYLSKAQRVHEDLLGSNHKFTQKDYRKLQELYNILQNQKKELFYRQKCITN